MEWIGVRLNELETRLDFRDPLGSVPGIFSSRWVATDTVLLQPPEVLEASGAEHSETQENNTLQLEHPSEASGSMRKLLGKIKSKRGGKLEDPAAGSEGGPNQRVQQLLN